MYGDNVILGVCGSPRARYHDTAFAIETIKHTQRYQELYSKIYDLASHNRVSNSEALMWMALFGAVREGAEIDILLLNDLYRQSPSSDLLQKNDLNERVMKAKGLILATPVYFGDCSSLTNRFMEDFSMKDKVIGVVSVGAKRNGGQETANIFTLMEAMSQGSIIVGNGPPTSQYGGTGWGGDVGAILDDNFGLDTSLGTGKRVMEVIKQIELPQTERARVALLTNSLFKKDAMIKEIKDEFLKNNQIRVDVIQIRDYNISPCKACSLCPKASEQKNGYGCIVEDDMRKIDNIILKCDGLALVIEDTYENESFWSGFKIFCERTRYIRRDHFRLADIPVIFFYRKDIQKSRFLDVKAITFMLRQNSIICGPIITRYFLGEKFIYENVTLAEACAKFIEKSRKRKHAVISKDIRKYKYNPIGYQIEESDE